MNKNRYCVIMAGGIGSRFWPLSREERPKQFIDVMGVGRTFIQLTFDRFAPMIPPENFLVVTSQRYKSLVLEQLPELNESQVLCEPMRRNTAPCIAYAIHRIASVNPSAVVTFTPADHLILKQTEFEKVISDSMDFAENNDVLVTVGVTPTRPETGYGYIQKGEALRGDDSLHRVKLFTEKPDLKMAEVFVSTGEFLWNSGIFVWSVPSIIKAFERFQPEIETLFADGADHYLTDREQEYIDSIYPECPNISIDYGIMEHADNVCVRCADLGWSDIGTWGSLYAMADKDATGNVTGGKTGNMLLSDVKGSIIKLSEGKRAIIDGLDGYILIEGGDTLLVCRRSREQDIRTWVDMINNDGHEK
ncbi:MAG: mannose-1-phosphate guanylyltransferase [Rikenellaceae bacterium]|nr:mannose-1-phosphate guanylyltransferase [Rikenellaceae bacterium]